MTGGAPPGARSNGVPVTSWWAPLGSCDPRVTAEVLAQLAGTGIAAYAKPDAGSQGGYLEVRPPHRPMDLLFVDGERRAAAETLVKHRLGDVAGSEDAAFAAIIAGFNDLPRGVVPASELPTPPPRDQGAGPGPLDPGGLLYDSPIGDGTPPRKQDPFNGDDEHFERPAVGKLAPVHTVTRTSIVALVVGVVLLVVPNLAVFTDSGLAETVGVLFVVGGAIGLLSRMREDRRDDDHPDDGAIV